MLRVVSQKSRLAGLDLLLVQAYLGDPKQEDLNQVQG